MNLLSVTIDWKAIGIEFAILVALIIIRSIILTVKIRRIYKQYHLFNYNYVLDHKKLLIHMATHRTRTAGIICVMLAVSSYELGNSSDFEHYMGMIKCKKMQSVILYWQAYYNFFNGNEAEFLSCYEKLKQMPPSDENNLYIEMLTLLLKKQKNEPISENELSVLSQTSSRKMVNYIKGYESAA